MKENKLTIVINRPIQEVFEFTTHPKNTPLWVDSVEEEIASEYPPHLGTEYKNRGKIGEWNAYRVSELEINQSFTLVDSKENYHVTYMYTALNEGQTELEYYEWVDGGELEEPFDQDVLLKLKSVMETNTKK